MISLFSLARKSRESKKPWNDSCSIALAFHENKGIASTLLIVDQCNEKNNLDTDNHNSSHKRINARKQSNSLDEIKNPSLSTGEFTQSHAATIEVPGTSIPSKDRITEVQMATDSASAKSADYQRSNLACHPESTMDIAAVQLDLCHSTRLILRLYRWTLERVHEALSRPLIRCL